MWLLEHDGNIFKGKRRWLRPGKEYLFGRTPPDKGAYIHTSNDHQFLVIEDKRVSRKHMTICVSAVPQDDAANLERRSQVVIKDLGTKHGTKINGKCVKDEALGLTKDDNEIQLGLFKETFRIKWHPVVIGFSFSKTEMEKGEAIETVRDLLEPLDIKYTLDTKITNAVTHVHSRKRNTPRVLQALIDGKYVITESFADAIAHAAVPQPATDGVEVSPLEEDFDRNWPDALQFLPSATDGPGVNLSNENFAPDDRRRDVFEGYTFIFYTKKSYDALVNVITGGKGKALLREVVPGETHVNDFVRYVKSVAGEKGLGKFEDGSEGRGVVVVRYVANENEEWYVNFFNGVALQLDHRPIETRDFLSAVLALKPAQLRRPLEVEPTPRESAEQDQSPAANATQESAAMELDEVLESPKAQASSPAPPPPRRTWGQRQRKFKGFDVDDDDDNDEAEDAVLSVSRPIAGESQGMFMTQPDEIAGPPPPYDAATSRSQTQTSRKRQAPPPDRDLLAELAPTTARIKRVRREGGEDPVPAPPPSPPPPVYGDSEKTKDQDKASAKDGKKKKKNKKTAGDGSEDELLDKLIQAGKEEENQRQAEEELFMQQVEGGEIDLKDIRDSMTVLQINLRRPDAARAQGAEETEDGGRWDPRWNSLRNFKKFRKQTKVAETAIPRTAPKRIISLEPDQSKEHGIGDDGHRPEGRVFLRQKQKELQQTQSSVPATRRGRLARAPTSSDSEDLDDAGEDCVLPEVIEMDAHEPARSRKGKAAERAGARQSQAAMSQTQTQNKRRAPEPPSGAEKPSKRRVLRATRRGADHESDDDDDDDEGDGVLGFQFGKRI